MNKDVLQILFENKLKNLTVRAKNILAALKLLNFESFYQYFIEQQKNIDFLKAKNCGTRTEKQLNEFVLEFIKEKEFENLPVDINTATNLKHEPFGVTPKIKLEFNRQFVTLSARTKNVLVSIGADKADAFFKKVAFPPFLKLILDIDNCGLKTFNEIQNFKNSILSLIDNNEYNQSKGFFNDLNFYLFIENVLKAEERYILKHYFGFVHPKEIKTINKIAVNFGLTKERIRQISFTVLDKTKLIASEIFSNGNYDLLRYFPCNFFYLTEEIASRINELEETHFSLSFITYVLESVIRPEYNFISTNNKMESYSGIFIKNIIQFDFKKCFEFLSRYLDIRRKEDVIIKIDDLVKSFKINPKNNSESSYDTKILCDKKQILEILSLYKELVLNGQNEIILNQDFISFKRNTKKLKYEFIFDILNEYKKPMHFTDLYEECVKRGIASTAFSIHGIMQRYPKVFGLKGPGIYGLLEWGGYFGSIGDVAEQLLKERNQPMDRKELVDILCRQLYITQDSINTVLFFYNHEKRFFKIKSHKIGLREWLTTSKK